MSTREPPLTTPLGNPKAESVGYDQYEQERQSGAAGRSK
jgi:hypothetical protein